MGDADLGAVMATVLDSFVPELPHLRADAQLDLVVFLTALEAYSAALDDPELHGLSVCEWRRVVAARVAIDLAFPHG